ncbi:O-antigen polysaccharide polymerase Wzy [Akkermansiaceae bacterium]|nr:O-antigen polysaccharide polymerase Wzy [Akkermansiaceae bacterium]
MIFVLGLCSIFIAYYFGETKILVVSHLILLFILFKVERHFLRFNFLFLVSYFLVSFHVFYSLEFFGNEFDKALLIWLLADEQFYQSALYLSTLGIYAYAFGYLKTTKLPKNIRNVNLPDERILYLYWATYVAYLAYLIFGQTYRASIYGYGIAANLENYVRFIFYNGFYSSLLVSGFLIKQRTKRKISFQILLRETPALLLVISILHFSLLLVQGDRGNLMVGIIILAAPIIFSNYLVGWVRGTCLVFVALLLAFVMKSYRSSTIGGRGFDKGIGWESTQVLNNLTAELGWSGRILNHALAEVSHVGYFYGWFHLKHLLAIIPGLSGFFSKMLEIPPRLDSSADFMSDVIQSGDVKYGDGTSILVDFYLDFGLVGVLGGMAIVGYLSKKVDLFFQNPNLRVSLEFWIFAVMFFSTAIYMPRGSMGMSLSLMGPIFLINRVICLK